MQVSFNPVKYNNNTSFKAHYSSEGQKYRPVSPTKDEIETARVKKVISELKWIAIGVGILYFAMKRNFKLNKIDQILKQEEKRSKILKPVPQLLNVNIDATKIIGG